MKLKSTGFALALCAIASLGTSAVWAATPFCVTITSANKTMFVGSTQMSQKSICLSKIEASNFSYGVSSPRDQSTGQATGRRQHKPIRIKKEWSAASPQLFQALVSGEPLSTVSLEFFSVDATGRLQVDHTINLTNAFITSIEHSLEARLPSGQPNIGENAVEIVEFTFQRIELVDSRGKTSAID